MDELTQLEQWAGPLLAKLQPGERRTLARAIGVELRRSQQQRIAQQRGPDGSAYAPRKRKKQLRDKAGRIKRDAMFAKIRQAGHLKLKTDADQIAIGFTGRVARIARVHQEGLVDRVSRGGLTVRYERRQLLGFTAAERERIRDLLMTHFAG
ncbi:MAG: phage virion morphogenesis protein [Lysobacter sp.]